MAEPQMLADGVAGTVIGADVWNGVTLVAADWSGGRLIALTGAALEPWGEGYQQPEGVSIAGDEILITERTGDLLRQQLTEPGRLHASVVASGLGEPHQVVRSDDGAFAYVADYAGGRIVRVDLASGTSDVAAAGLQQPVGVAIDASGALFVTEQGRGALTVHTPAGASSVVVGSLTSPFFLSWADPDRTKLLITERAPVNRVGIVDVTAPVPEVQRLVGRGITQPSQALLMADRLLVTGENRVLALDASGGLRADVRVVVPDTPLWPGSWTDVAIDTGTTGWVRGDLTVETEPVGALTVDEHPSALDDPSKPTVRLLAHTALGPVDVVVREAATGDEVGRGTVTVGFDPTSPKDGPPVWLDWSSQPSGLHVLSAERGVADAADLRPVDWAGVPTGAWRVLAVLVDTKDSRWSDAPGTPAPTTATAKTTWGQVFTGGRGVDRFYREMSGGRMSVDLLTGAVQGPVQLDGTWTDWFTMPTGLNQWLVKDDVVARVASALQSVTDWTSVDAVFLIFRSPNATNYIWPRASGRAYAVQGKDKNGKDVSVKVAKVGMPHDQTTAANLGFDDVEVSSHELGHTLGLDDIYMDSTFSAGMQARALGTRELMGNESGFPHLSARHKLLLGYLDPAHIRSFDYAVPENVPVDLAALSDGIPSAGTFAAVELKVAPRSSWFFEYRAPRPGRIGDNSGVFAGGWVMGYDATKYALPPIAADKRPPVILLLDDGDGEGAILTGGTDYDHVDVEGQALSEFRLQVLSINGATAKLQVTVGSVSAPDPFIVTNAGEQGDYKSPDIQIRNELSDKDDAWLNRPIIGVNRVVATIHNGGGLDAPGVTVRFKVLPFSTDDPDSERWSDLGEPVKHDVATGPATVEFQTEWSPDRDAHFCVQARIDRYVRVPTAAADEPDVDNNLAQSNYFTIESKTASPSSREVSYIDVHNPYGYAADALVDFAQDSNAYRTFIDHQWLHLAPGETRQVRIEVESKADSVWQVVESRYPDGRSWLRTWLPAAGCVARTGSGVTLHASTVVETSLRVIERGDGLLLVRVSCPSGAPSPSDGVVLMQVDYDDGRHEVVSAPVEAGGHASLRYDDAPGTGTLHFGGRAGYGTASGMRVDLQRN